MALNEAQIAANELERVEPNVPTLYDLSSTFYSNVPKKPAEKVSNRQMRVPLELRSGGSFGHFDPDGGSLGPGDGPVFDKGVLNVAHLRKPVEYTKLAEWSTDDARKAVLNTVRLLLKRAMQEFRRSTDSLCMTAGDGVLGTVSAVSTGGGKDTLTLNTTGANSSGWGHKLLRYGMFHSIYASDLLTRRTYTGGASTTGGEAPIDLYNFGGKQVRVNGSTGATVAGDKVVVSGLTATPPVSILGVAYHHNDATSGTWLGLDRTANPEVVSNSVNANSAQLALPFARLAMNKLLDRLGIEQSLGQIVAYMHMAQKSAYEELGQVVQLINVQGGNTGKLNRYFDSDMQLAGAPVKISASWDRTRIDFINPSLWGRAEMYAPGFYEADGRKIFEKRSSDGTVATSMLFYICASWNLFVSNPAATSYIKSLAVPSGY